MDLCERVCTPQADDVRQLCAALHQLGVCAPEGETFFPRWGAWETLQAPRDGPREDGPRACERFDYSG